MESLKFHPDEESLPGAVMPNTPLNPATSEVVVSRSNSMLAAQEESKDQPTHQTNNLNVTAEPQLQLSASRQASYKQDITTPRPLTQSAGKHMGG